MSTTIEEQAPHGANQEVKNRCSLGEVSIPTSIQHQTVANLVSYGYTSDEVREALHVECIVKEESVIETFQEDIQFQHPYLH